jgi:hypothetical protein
MSHSYNSSMQRKEAIRTGVIHHQEITFGSEERFSWQKPKYVCDVTYDPPNSSSTKSVLFGTSSRAGGADFVDPETKKRSNGPGSYDYARSYDFNSEYVSKKGIRFAGAPRQSMAMKTPSPGAVYDIQKKYYMGPETSRGISFGKDVRKPLASSATSADAEILVPKLPSAPAISFGKKIPLLKKNNDVPGAIYDVHVSSSSSSHNRILL